MIESTQSLSGHAKQRLRELVAICRSTQQCPVQRVQCHVTERHTYDIYSVVAPGTSSLFGRAMVTKSSTKVRGWSCSWCGTGESFCLHVWAVQVAIEDEISDSEGDSEVEVEREDMRRTIAQVGDLVRKFQGLFSAAHFPDEPGRRADETMLVRFQAPYLF